MLTELIEYFSQKSRLVTYYSKLAIQGLVIITILFFIILIIYSWPRDFDKCISKKMIKRAAFVYVTRVYIKEEDMYTQQGRLRPGIQEKIDYAETVFEKFYNIYKKKFKRYLFRKEIIRDPYKASKAEIDWYARIFIRYVERKAIKIAEQDITEEVRYDKKVGQGRRQPHRQTRNVYRQERNCVRYQ